MSSLKSPKRIVMLALVAALAILVAGGIRAARRATSAEPLLGVELGMSADDVRASFQPGESGFFMVGSEEGEPLLVWRPRGRARDGLGEARFEFDDGAMARARFAFALGTSNDEAMRALRIAEGDADHISLRTEDGRGPVVWYGPPP